MPALRAWTFRGVLLALLFGCLTGAPSASAALAPAGQDGLSRSLVKLATPALRAQSPVRQAALLDVARSGPGSLLRDGRRVDVKLRFAGDALSQLGELRQVGAEVLSASRRFQTVSASVLPADLADLVEVPGVRAVWPSRAPILYGAGVGTAAVGEGPCEGGAAISEGLGQLRVDAARETYGLRGKGVTVGVLSDSYDVAAEAADGSGPVAAHAQADVESNDLPGLKSTCSAQQAPVRVLAEGPVGVGEDEGRAMAQIVHDLAPHASLAFATAFESEESFAHNIETLARPVSQGGAGAQVIVDDVAWFEEPFFQDGPVADAVNKVSAEGVTYLSSAGNDNLFQGGEETTPGEAGIASWEAPAFRDSASCPAAIEALPPLAFNAKHCMDFDPEEPNLDDTFGVTVDAGATLTADLQWAEPWNGVSTDLDAFLLNSGGKIIALAAESNTGKAGTQRPYELLQWENKSGTAQTVELAINRFAGATPRLKVALLENGAGVSATEYPKSSEGDVVGPTVFGHAGAASAIAVAAVPFTTSAQPEEYSSRGPVTHYFEAVEGLGPAAPLGAPETIPKPDVAATDCGATTFFARLFAGTWRFCGTSAAAPHAAAVAALLRQSQPAATVAQIREALSESAVAVGAFGPDAVGSGLVDAKGAIEVLPPLGLVDDGPSTVVPAVEPGGQTSTGGGSHAEEPAVLPQPPSTFFSRRPARLVRTRTRLARVVFRFGSDQASVSFLCKLDAGPFRACRSPLVRMLRSGTHMLRVQARSSGGLRDATPASYRFRIERVP